MGRRSEVRIAKYVSILVHGTDPNGSPFRMPAKTVEISGTGASLTELNGAGPPGAKIEIEYQGKKARFRIQWVGKDGTKRANQVGVRGLEPGNIIWGVELPEWTLDTFEPVRPEDARTASAYGSGNGSAAKGKERRVFLRHTCRIEAVVIVEGTDLRTPTIVSDLSVGGCYLEMLSPFPKATRVELTMNLSHVLMRAHGEVRSSQSGLGMGMFFTRLRPEDFEKLRKLAAPEAIAPKPANAVLPLKAAIAASLPRPAEVAIPPTGMIWNPSLSSHKT
jgi:hypothetical protein